MMIMMIVTMTMIMFRCTFTTDKSISNQEMADAVLFHMPNFHWDKCVVRHNLITIIGIQTFQV